MNTFDFEGLSLRSIELDGAPWFVAVDVCRCICLPVGGKSGGVTRYLNRLDSDERRIVRKNGCGSNNASPLFDTPGGGANTYTVITESGLYKLIMRSSKAAAKKFQNWVTREVLPAIRKTGGYLLNEAARETAAADTRTDMPLPAVLPKDERSAGAAVRLTLTLCQMTLTLGL